MSVGAEKAVEEALDANEDDGEDEEDVGEVLGELADGVLGAVVPHVPGLVARVPGAGQVGATLVILTIKINTVLLALNGVQSLSVCHLGRNQKV